MKTSELKHICDVASGFHSAVLGRDILFVDTESITVTGNGCVATVIPSSMEGMPKKTGLFLPVLSDVIKVCVSPECTITPMGIFVCGDISTKIPTVPYQDHIIPMQTGDNNIYLDVLKELMKCIDDKQVGDVIIAGNEFRYSNESTCYRLSWDELPPVNGVVSVRHLISMSRIIQHAIAKDIWTGYVKTDGNFIVFNIDNWYIRTVMPQNTRDVVELIKEKKFTKLGILYPIGPLDHFLSSKAERIRWKVDSPKRVKITTEYDRSRFALTVDESYELTQSMAANLNVPDWDVSTRRFNLGDALEIEVAGFYNISNQISNVRFTANNITVWTTVYAPKGA